MQISSIQYRTVCIYYTHFMGTYCNFWHSIKTILHTKLQFNLIFVLWYRDSSEGLGDTGIHNISRENIIRRILFITGCWCARKSNIENCSTKIYRVIKTDNLGTILLFEADFNFANKLYFGIRLMKRAEISVVLPQEQHGGRSGHT